MNEPLVLLRVIGGALGLVIVLWAFARFRVRLIKRHEYLLLSLFGAGLLVVAVYPDSINTLAGMLSMQDRQFGRLITLLILSNMLLWVLIFNLRSRDAGRSVQFDLLVRKLAMQRFLEKDGRDKIKEITVIIPALNEAENLEQILPLMPETVGGHSVGVLVVDDGSEDETVAVVKKHGCPVVSNPVNRGGGAALRLGYDIARAGGAKIVVTMDADGQHQPGEIERLVEPVLSREADFVIGSRVLGKGAGDSIVRWLGIRIFNLVINALARTRVTDCSSGYRAFSVESLTKVLLLQDRFHTAELIIDAAKKGLRIRDVPVTMLSRRFGKSKKGETLAYGFNFFGTIIKTWFRK